MRFKLGLYVFATIVGVLAFAPRAFPQGCIPDHYMSLSLGAEGIQYLPSGEWEGGVSYRYLHSENVFIGREEQPQLHEVGGRNSVHSIDLTATYGMSSRFGLSLTIPFAYDDFSGIQGDQQRHSGSSGGVGDVRLVATGWVLDPDERPTGNVNLGLGVKFPTGDYRATSNFHTADDQVIHRPVDVAAQLGDGGWGIVLQMQAFQKLGQDVYTYAEGLYLINPRKNNGTERPPPGTSLVNSVPDQYFGRLGLSYVIWPAMGLSFNLGGRIDGIPVGDLVGGRDNGFRRAGYSIYVDPGLSWVDGKNLFSLNIPVAVERNVQRTSTASGGGLADFLVIASYSRRF